MAENPQPSLNLPIGPTLQRRGRGRPKGAVNKRSMDLARYIEATYGGQTPGQQAAAVSMVTPADLRQAKARAKELGIVDAGLAPVLLAMVVKARQLATALGCEARDAWMMMVKERGDLMAYVHQKQPQAAEAKDKALPVVYAIPGEAPLGALPELVDADPAAIEIVDDFGERQP